MHKLGLSVYPEKASYDDILAYLRLGAKYGFSRIFTCLLSVEGPKEDIMKEFGQFMTDAHDLGYEVAVDTNPEVFKHLGATADNLKPFADMGVDIVRLDGSFGTIGDIACTRNPYGIRIEFNGSMDQGVELLLNQGANKDQVTICHNFFPERWTGLDWELFQNLNTYWKSINLTTAAFVSSNAENTHGPWNVFCGLPTVEFIRTMPIDLQARYYLATDNVDDIIIGNAFATEDELKVLSELNFQKTMLDVEEVEGLSDVEKEIIYDYSPHWDRFDHSSYIMRSSMCRLNYKNTSIPHRPCDKKMFTKGDILIVNDNLAHYRGELEIVLQDIPNDGERNLCGRVPENELALMDLIRPGFHFGFIKK